MSTNSIDLNLKFRSDLNANGLFYLIFVVMFSRAVCFLYLVSRNLGCQKF
jgi:hypothetical protein